VLIAEVLHMQIELKISNQCDQSMLNELYCTEKILPLTWNEKR